jgi:hypothetical protein
MFWAYRNLSKRGAPKWCATKVGSGLSRKNHTTLNRTFGVLSSPEANTRGKYLKGAPLGKALTLLANIRLLIGTNALAYLESSSLAVKESLITSDPEDFRCRQWDCQLLQSSDNRIKLSFFVTDSGPE